MEKFLIGNVRTKLLFVIYDEAMVKEATANEELGVKVGGQVISMIIYADDKAVVASREKNLQRLMDSISRVTQEYGMINVKKTKAMCISRQGKSKVKIYVDGQLLEQVQQFRYPGSLITEDGYCHKEIRSRIGLAKVKFMERKKILTSKKNLDLRKQIVRCLVWSVALYAAETWTISKTDMKRIEAFEMWMEKISWTAKVRNSEVLNRVKGESLYHQHDKSTKTQMAWACSPT